ncbi:TetR/AcrR family transcriptional regulator [Calothrix sp. UHCC 0171]|uniref:TetR/AcrR family transcriptional regulator n=1 Tax=Calothrix sp. UHCC 0171 TaxID=3110245 RepID=UPI002B1FF4F0|nr:TetR/AcrR family transcriptional regulator [Calothrix sp. UHCC 0171]MEA5570644.1 TetR/AcrR family transcriptional regulator [Calothrix sp. UHCC 0171]
MSKGEETKAMIIEKSAALFNQQGYAGSSMSDIMQVTGLQKGGIYNHFASKDDLALQAFDYAVSQIQQRFREAWKDKNHAIERLQAIINVFRAYIDNPEHPIMKGGCPLLNTAVESDDAHPALKARAKQAMNSWSDLLSRIIRKGIKKGEIQPNINVDEVTSIIISTLEGSVMMSKLCDDSIHLERAIAHLNNYINSSLKA